MDILEKPVEMSFVLLTPILPEQAPFFCGKTPQSLWKTSFLLWKICVEDRLRSGKDFALERGCGNLMDFSTSFPQAAFAGIEDEEIIPEVFPHFPQSLLLLIFYLKKEI
ncbi:hypothetical protein BST81_11855 [Leptolyngbya sp. 'hensonii']|uniref:hypothetical protein n=1 Tax=Leptolyngbya sp. 'hensonii' TaxID=1922337 RepID=UPI00094FD52E|nr:hypothetical protein [Leptolyngbya sp. 'hensonii']OLP18242.1 hypothetical protein BST81_11855 [Leptolyngbya sp. 'hensonii']